MTNQFFVVKKGLSGQRLENPPNPLFKIDTTRSSLGEGPKSVEAGPFELEQDELLKLQIFTDKSVVEVFANDRQALMRRIYPNRSDSQNVVLFSHGGAAEVKSIEAWDMAPSNPW